MAKKALLAVLMSATFSLPAQCQNNDFVGHCSRLLDEMSKDNAKWREYADFFRTRAKRARLDGEIIKADQEGIHRRDFWVLAVDPKDRDKFELASMFQYQSQKDLLILPSRGYTPSFFFLGLLHELVHAQDVLKGREARKPTDEQFYQGELRAFEIELEALVIMTKGRFRSVIKEIVVKKRLISIKGVAIPNEEAEDELDRLTTHPFPRSEDERAQRRALYSVAVNFEIDPRIQAKLRFLRKSQHAFGQYK